MNYLIIQITILCIVGLSSAMPSVPDLSEEYGDKYQGDIVLTAAQARSMNSGRAARTGIINKNLRWPKVNNRVVVPYLIDSIYTTSERNMILGAMNEIQTKTCVTFVPRTTQYDYIRIFSGDGCWSYLGRIGGKQDLSLKRSGCMVHGICMHEIFHALGYGHMHQHPNRDEKVIIKWENIQSGQSTWFEKFDTTKYNNFNTPFDVGSVMHYGSKAFSKNGQLTIVAKNANDQKVMGQRSSLSAGDVSRIKNMYTC